jgi:hypothetical protein
MESGPFVVVVFAGVGTSDLRSVPPAGAWAAALVELEAVLEALLGAAGFSAVLEHPETIRPTDKVAAARTAVRVWHVMWTPLSMVVVVGP